MENEIRHYIDSLNHDPIWVGRITNDIDKLLVNHEYIDFFMQIHKTTRINENNGKTEHHGRTHAKNVVALEPGWIREIFEFSEPEFYKLVTTVTCDETQNKTYTVPVGRCAIHTSVYEPNFVDMHHNALICLGKSNKK